MRTQVGFTYHNEACPKSRLRIAARVFVEGVTMVSIFFSPVLLPAPYSPSTALRASRLSLHLFSRLFDIRTRQPDG
jgi:hypothetical protein